MDPLATWEKLLIGVIGVWIIAGVVSLSLAIPVGLVLYLAYQTWRGDLREAYATESHRSSSLVPRWLGFRYLRIQPRQSVPTGHPGEAW